MPRGSGGPLNWYRKPPAPSSLPRGFRIDVFDDKTADAIAKQKGRADVAGSQSTLGVHIVLGADGVAMLRNSVRNFREGLIGLVQGLATSVV